MNCDHTVGNIAGKNIRDSLWVESFAAFVEKVRAFNLLTGTKQIPHPGFAKPFNFCPDCGAKLEPKSATLPQYAYPEGLKPANTVKRTIVVDPKTATIYAGAMRGVTYWGGLGDFRQNDIPVFDDEAQARRMLDGAVPDADIDSLLYPEVEYDRNEGYMRTQHLERQGFLPKLDQMIRAANHGA